MEGPFSFGGYKEQESNLILPEHDDDDIRLQLQFIIHFLPVSSGFHMDTRAFRSLLRLVYALPTVQGT
jgi:hypothetical protein